MYYSVRSAPFHLNRGTRQGYPLSPLLFAIVEPLAIWLCKEEHFNDITHFGETHKLLLFTDDVLLYVSEPPSSVPVTLMILERFVKFLGYKPNLQKSEWSSH